MSVEVAMTTNNVNNVATAAVAEIRVGTRHRSDMGDLAGLAKSIRDVGLLHPLVVTADMELVAGARRLAAVQELGWDRVPVRVVAGLSDALAALRAERDENTCRKDFTPSEAVALGKKLEEPEAAEAKKRQQEGGRAGGKGSGKLPELSKGQTRDKAAEAVGMSGRNYEKAKAVVEAAEREPEKYGDLAREMDKTGKVDPAHKNLKQRGGARAGKKGRGKPESGAGKKMSKCKRRLLKLGVAPELVEMVECGQVSVVDAETLSCLRKPQQKKLAEAGAAAVKAKAADLRWLARVPRASVFYITQFDPHAEVSNGARREALEELNKTMEELKAASDTLAGLIDTLIKKLDAEGAAPEQPGDAQVQKELFPDGAAA